jgi:hypothetical protein
MLYNQTCKAHLIKVVMHNCYIFFVSKPILSKSRGAQPKYTESVQEKNLQQCPCDSRTNLRIPFPKILILAIG